jgi:hypothetical protein
VEFGHQFRTVVNLAPQLFQSALWLNVAGIKCISQLLLRLVFYF